MNMKLINPKLLFCAATLFAVISCNDDLATSSSGEDKVAVSIEANIAGNSVASYASNNLWSANDVIGLTMLNTGGKDVVNDVFNYIYNTPTGTTSFVPRSEGNTAYFPQDGSAVKINAYYPYYAALTRTMDIPLSVVDQTALPKIDLMTAEHLAGFSKTDALVHLNFHHRLSKVIFNLSMSDGDQTIPLEDFELTIKGMQTTGSYNLLNSILTADAASTADVVVPMRDKAAERYGIVLPRAAAAGVTFEFKAANGSVYTAVMGDNLALQGGYKYTFNIKLQKTPVTVSATIEEWKDGATSYYDALEVSTPAGVSDGVNVGDKMNVYIKEAADYAPLKSFTYNNDGRWYAESPLYWQDITPNPAPLRASIVAAPAINPTQLADILISNEISVARNTGADFTFKHAASKVFVRLASNTFTAAELATATLTLPGYLTGGKELNGAFVPGTTVADISVDRSDPGNGIALFQPQTIAAGNSIVKVVLNGRTYNATSTSAFAYTAGEAKILTITINKEAVSLSARVVDWILNEKNLDAITVGTVESGAVGVLDGEVMTVYTGDTANRSELTQFTYNQAADLWSTNAPAYWESLSTPTRFYASILRQAKYNATQLDDHLVAKPVVVAASNGVAFELSHPASKIVVQLVSSDGSFNVTELEAMKVTLPNYANGATVNNGIFIPGAGVGNITVAKNVGDDGKSAIAIVQPQTIAAGTTIADILDPVSGRIYKATDATDVAFEAGVATVLKIDLKKTAVSVSAKVIDWEAGDTINLVPSAITVGGTLESTAGFFENKTIHVYKLGSDFASLAYSYLPRTGGFAWSGAPIYWDDQRTYPVNLTGVFYPTEDLIPNVTGSTTQFNWNLPIDQSKGYDKYDILTNALSLASAQYANFKFVHPLSKVRVELSSSEFTAAELQNAKLTLTNFIVDGAIKLADGKVYPTTAVKNIASHVDVDGSKYSALVMPQVIAANTSVVSIVLKDYPNTPFVGKLTAPLNFVPGKETVIKINMKRTLIELSATLEPWTAGETGSIIIQ